MNTNRAFLFSLMLASFGGTIPAAAQDSGSATAGTIKMNIPGTAGQSPVRLSTMSVDVQVMGNIATTTLDMVFVNETNRILEGEFEFPLGEGEAVTGYALDINGRLRHGVVVEKDKGRQVFEAVVRQGIDPGLVEMTAGNNFKTRVYPLPAQGSRRVQVTYQSELRPSARNSTPRQYTFAALTAETLDSFDFKITVLDVKTAAAPATGSSLLTFDQMNSGYSANFSRQNFAVTEPISVALPAGTAAGNGVVFTEDIGKDTFFYYYQPVTGAAVAKRLPRRLVIYYDISDSMKNRNMDAEFSLLAAYLGRLNAPTVTVVPFCNELYEANVFTGTAEQVARDIRAFVQAEGFDGATNLDVNFAAQFPADEVLVFTDGIGTWGGSGADGAAVAAKRPDAPTVSTVNSCVSANHAWLQQTAQQNGGQYINLCARSTEQALSALTSDPLRLIRAEYDTAALSDVYPLDGSIVDGDFSLSGRLVRKQAAVTLYFGHGNTVEQTVPVTVSAVDGIAAGNVARQWAAKKINALSLDYDANRDEITAVAKQYGIVTRDTSLIVLDSVQDYVRYGIVPPEELRAEYDRLVSRQPTVKPVTEQQDAINQSVFTKFEEFRTWWNTSVEEFKKRKQPQKKTGLFGGRRAAEEVAVEGGAPVEMLYDAVEERSYAMAAPAPLAEAAPMAEAVPDIAERQTVTRTQGRAAMGASASAMAASSAADAAAPAAPDSGSTGTAATIQLQAWSPNAEYLSVLKRTRTNQMYAKYLELKAQYAASPAFYMEVSDYFAEEGLAAQSLRILSNLAELELENTDILRALGNKLMEREAYQLAVPVFEKLVRLRGEIPQFYRDLGMAYYYSGKVQQAVDTLYSVVHRTWDGRFAEVEQIALNDMNAIIAAAGGAVDTSAIDKRLLQNFDVDVRIVLTWNIDNCDVDLWVTDKDGEKCYYGNKLTANGGRMSRDFTQGYGPEEFCIKVAPGGKLKIEANYFGNHQQKLLQPVAVQAEVYTNFGRPNQKRQVLTLQLDSVKQTFLVGEVKF